MGSPMGASCTTVTSEPGMTPISRKCWRSAPSPPTFVMMAGLPMAASRSEISGLAEPADTEKSSGPIDPLFVSKVI